MQNAFITVIQRARNVGNASHTYDVIDGAHRIHALHELRKDPVTAKQFESVSFLVYSASMPDELRVLLAKQSNDTGDTRIKQTAVDRLSFLLCMIKLPTIRNQCLTSSTKRINAAALLTYLTRLGYVTSPSLKKAAGMMPWLDEEGCILHIMQLHVSEVPDTHVLNTRGLQYIRSLVKDAKSTDFKLGSQPGV
jgi:hypothetical protein